MDDYRNYHAFVEFVRKGMKENGATAKLWSDEGWQQTALEQVTSMTDDERIDFAEWEKEVWG